MVHKQSKMGYIRHHTIVVTGWDEKAVIECREKAIEIFKSYKDVLISDSESLISEIVRGLANAHDSFFYCPRW